MFEKINIKEIDYMIESSGEWNYKPDISGNSEINHKNNYRYHGGFYNVQRHLAKFLKTNRKYDLCCLDYDNRENGDFSFEIWSNSHDRVITIKCKEFVKFQATVKSYKYCSCGAYLSYKHSDGYKTREEFRKDFDDLRDYLEDERD